MRNNILRVLTILLAAHIGSPCFAQDAEQKAMKRLDQMNELKKGMDELKQPAFFKLDFVLKEVDGNRVVNSRSYSTYAATNVPTPGSIRTSAKVPDSPDVGVRIDIRNVRELQDRLALNLTADVTSIPPQDSTATPVRTVMRTYVWSSDVLIPLKKPTVVFSSDSTTSKTQMQLELTATPVL